MNTRIKSDIVSRDEIGQCFLKKSKPTLRNDRLRIFIMVLTASSQRSPGFFLIEYDAFRFDLVFWVIKIENHVLSEVDVLTLMLYRGDLALSKLNLKIL